MRLLLLFCGVLLPASILAFCGSKESCTYNCDSYYHLAFGTGKDGCSQLQCQDGVMQGIQNACSNGPNDTCVNENFRWVQGGNEYVCKEASSIGGEHTYTARPLVPFFDTCKYGEEVYNHLDLIRTSPCAQMQCQNGQLVYIIEACYYNRGCYRVNRTLSFGSKLRQCIKKQDGVYEWQIIQPQKGRKGCQTKKGKLRDGQRQETDDGCSSYQCQNGEMVLTLKRCKDPNSQECYNDGQYWATNSGMYKCNFFRLFQDWHREITVIRERKPCKYRNVLYENLQTVVSANQCVEQQCQDGEMVAIREGCYWRKDKLCHPVGSIWSSGGKCYQCQRRTKPPGDSLVYVIVTNPDGPRDCEKTPSPCEQICTNTKKGHRCSCRAGYTRDRKDKSKCRDENECSEPTKNDCDQICTNTLGSYRCECRDGFRMVKGECIPISTCQKSPCDQICTDTATGVECSCRDGYEVNPSNSSQCNDIDECKQGRPCEQICTNIEGGYVCSCKDGYEKDEVDSTKCTEIEQCEPNGDMVLLLDASGSILVEDYRIELDFAARLTMHFPLGPDQSRFGAVVFSGSATKEFDLKTYNDHNALAQAIKSLPYAGMDTPTDMALQLVQLEQMFSNRAGGRDNAPDVVLLFTDGQSNSQARTVIEASKLKDQGVIIVCLGIGDNVSNDELIAVASSPDLVFNAKSFDQLQSVEAKLTQAICDAIQSQTDQEIVDSQS